MTPPEDLKPGVRFAEGREGTEADPPPGAILHGREAPSFPTITWHLVMGDDRTRTVCTGAKWEPPSADEYPDVPREMCVACVQFGLPR
jgi:hypothetical protein